MQFTALHLVGFKSFVEKTGLEIRPGLTGIVGPNGCGKSNLVEALRWVMGETSAKRMRGTGMEDVIFSGTASRPARENAEVTMMVDNRDRRAPAVFNQHEALEITRKITRGGGSEYRVNGKLARARDVQLLFADSGSGAGSAGMVSQGQIGQMITGRPRDRHRILEEAAGVSGLHARRHEAELKLRAAETNLDRIEDVLVTMAGQLKGLKNQARRATRYRNLQKLIRQFEAMSFIHLWSAIETEVVTAREAHAEAEQATRQHMAEVARLSTAQTKAEAGLPKLREAEAEAAARLQRVSLEARSLEEEAGRIRGAIERARRQIEQVIRDRGREDALDADARAALERIAADLEALSAQQADAPAELDSARGDAEDMAAKRAEIEAEIQQRGTDLARQSAQADALARQVAQGLRDSEQAALKLDQLETEVEQCQVSTAEGDKLAEAEATAKQAAANVEQLKAAAEQADAARRDSDKALAQARRAHDDSFTTTTRLKAEVDALAQLVAGGGSSQKGKAPKGAQPEALITKITVDAGYEKALAAAFGDTLDASHDASAPVFWAELEGLDPPDWADGLTPLAGHVTVPPVLARALAFVALAKSGTQAAAAQADLPAGAIIVTPDGASWRWDGLVTQAGAPSAAAVRLEQANRLDALRSRLAALEAEAAATRAALDQAMAADQQARQAAGQARHDLNQGFEAINTARRTLEALTRQQAEHQARLARLSASRDQARQRVEELAAQLAAAREAQAALPDLQADEQALQALRDQLVTARQDAEAARDRLNDLNRQAQARTERQQSLQAEQAAWQERMSGTEARLAELSDREQASQSDLQRLTGRPAELDAKRQDLLTRQGELEQQRNQAADALAQGEATAREAASALKQAEAALSDSREARARAESAVALAQTRRQELAARIEDKLQVPASALPDIAEKAADELPPAHDVTRELERLTRERENMGAVNLLAEEEAGELSDEITTMEQDRDDLTAAIAKLRQGIGKLNAEARTRLNASFDMVNEEFARIFTTLFGGGKAHLELVGADDPLEAGLEIYASPPGKRLQVMSLLSGGEQALTALSLLTAVFLSNPAPICVLDEVDAPLDDTNVDRFCQLLDHMVARNNTRFIIITHHRLTMARMDRLYGVTMAEKGVSQLVSVDLGRAERMVS